MAINFEKPYIELTITTQQGREFTLINQDYGGDIVSYNFNKSVDAPYGSFSFQMPDKRGLASEYIDFRKTVRAMSLVEVKINGTYRTIGIIQGVRKTVEISGGKPIRLWNFNCVELGILFNTTRIWYDISTTALHIFQAGSPQLKYLNTQRINPNTITDKSIQNIVEQVFKQWFYEVYDQIGFIFADGSKLSEKIIVDRQYFAPDIFIKEILTLFHAYNYQGDVWGALQNFITRPFHEMWGTAGGKTVVLGDNDSAILEEGKYYLILRATPYDNNKIMQSSNLKNSVFNFENLNEISISDDVITSKDLGVSGEQMFSFYSLTYGGNNLPQNYKRMLVPPIYDLGALKRYGYVPFERQIKALSFTHSPELTAQNKGLNQQITEIMQKRIFEWFKFNDRFLTGSFTVKGNPLINEGMRLRYDYDLSGKIEDENELGEYYIQGFNESWVYGQSYTTQIQVIRGIPDNQKWQENWETFDAIESGQSPGISESEAQEQGLF